MILVFETAREEDATELAALRNEAAKDLTAKFGRGPWSAGCAEKSVLFGMRTSQVVVARCYPHGAGYSPDEPANRSDAESSEADSNVGITPGRIVGTFSLQTKKPWAIDPAHFTKVPTPLYLVSMFVAVERQGEGIGRKLLEEAVRIAKDWPAYAIRLDAYDAMAGAGDFYAKCGFREVGRAKYKEVPLRYFELIIEILNR